MPNSPLSQSDAHGGASLLRVLEPVRFERGLEGGERLPEPGDVLRALPGHHRIGAKARKVRGGIELRCPIPGLLLHAGVGRSRQGDVMSATVDLLPGFRLLLAALFVCLAALAIALPLKVVILMASGTASASTLIFSLGVSLLCLGSGALMAGAQAAGRRISEHELLEALEVAQRRAMESPAE